MIHVSHLQRKIQVVLAGLVFALTLTACCPYPHDEREAPVFDGTLTRQGTPAANIRVTLSTRTMSSVGCADPKVETRTDSSGKFHLDPPQYSVLGIGFGDRLDTWSVCFKFADGLEAVWNDDGYWGGPGFEILECEISADKSPSGTLQLGKITAGANLANGCRVQSFSTADYTKTREAQRSTSSKSK